MGRLIFGFILGSLALGMPHAAWADDAPLGAEANSKIDPKVEAQAKKALHDAESTNNTYVIDAVKAQLVKDHPELKDWLLSNSNNESAPPSSSGRVNTYAFSSPPAAAPVPIGPPDPNAVHYKAEVEGGFVENSGNTKGYSFNTKDNVTRDSQDWRYLAEGSAELDNDGTKPSQENYFALGQANYKLTPDERLMTTLFWNSNRFTGFRNRFEEVSGFSDDWQLPDKIKLTTELAGGARQLTLTNGEYFGEPILWVRGNISWPFAERWTLAEDLRDSLGSEYNFIHSNASLTLAMTQHWKLRLALEDDYVNNPPLHRQALDTNTLINLVYDFNN